MSTAQTPSGSFRTTRWSVVLKAGSGSSPEAREALDRLARSYWYPLYAYVRRRGYADAEARDLTQGLFLRLLEKDHLKNVDRRKGRFRAYLLTAVKNHVANERERERVAKRGGDRLHLSIDAGEADTRYGLEPAASETPESLFEKSWAHSVLERAIQRVGEIYAERKKSELFEKLRDRLVGGSDERSYADLAAELGMSEGSVKVAVHRLRRGFATELRAEIAETLADPADVDDELRHLLEVLGQ